MNPATFTDFDSPPLTPSASDISDIGSLSDSEWLEVTSSSHASDSEDDSDDEIERLSIAQANPDGLQLALATDPEWHGVPDEQVAQQQSIASQTRSLADSVAAKANDPTDVQSFVQAVSDALQNEQSASDPNVAYESPSPDDLKLEFPDPLSSSSDDMLASTANSSMDSTGTWTHSDLHSPRTAESDPAPAADDAEAADLHIIVLGNRPNVLRTQRIINVLVEAIGDALAASHLVHHTHTARRTGPLFGTHEIAHGKLQTFRIVASDGIDLDKAHLLPAYARTLALVFFSPTRITRSLPELAALPASTKFLPLIPSHGGQSPQSRIIASDDSFGFPSSVESSVLVGSPDNINSLSAPLHAKRVNLEWHALSTSIPKADVLDLWPRGATRNDQVVMPTALLERPAAMVGMRKGFFTTSEEAPATFIAKLAMAKDGRDEPSRLIVLIRDYHAWTAIALISMLLAVFSSQYVTLRTQSVSETSGWRNATPATTTAPPPMPSAIEALPPPPPSSASTQDTSLLPTSFRNLALSVFGNDDTPKAIAEVPRPASPRDAAPAQRDTTGAKAPQASNTNAKQKVEGTSAGESQTRSPTPSKADDLTHAPAQTAAPATTPLTLDEPPRRITLPTRASIGAAAAAWPREMRELMVATDDLLAAVRRNLVAAASGPAAEFVATRHARARHNARRLARRAHKGLRRVTDWSKGVSMQRETRWVDRARRGVEGIRRVDWQALRLQRAMQLQPPPAAAPKARKVKCSTLLCGVLGRDRAA